MEKSSRVDLFNSGGQGNHDWNPGKKRIYSRAGQNP